MKKALLGLFLILMPASLAWGGQAKVDTTGLTAYYPFNGTADDASGHGKNGTVFGATLSANRFGIPNAAYHFDGSNDYIRLWPSQGFGLYDHDFTISTWINGASYNSRDAGIVGNKLLGTSTCLALMIRNAQPLMDFVNNWTYAKSTTLLQTGRWYHVVFRYTKLGGQQAIFIDGTLDTTGVGHSAYLGTDTLYVGRWYVDRYFYGSIDDIRIYSRALTGSEIIELYNETQQYIIPIPIYPINNQLVNSHDVSLVWHASDSAISYNVQVSPDSTFSGVEFDHVTTAPDTAATAQGLIFSNYFWRVRAYRAIDTSAWSSLAKFRIDTIPPPAPTLVTPANGAILTDSITRFHWNVSAGAQRYRILVTSDSLGLVFTDSATVDTAGYRISYILPESLYYWKVKAADSAGNWSDYSEQRWFKTSIIPRLIAPVHNATLASHTVGLSWYGVYGAVSYQVQVSIDSTFAAYEINRTVAVPDTQTTVAGLVYNAYFWRVRAIRSSDTSGWSAVRKFNISAPPPAVPVLISPDSGAVVADSQPHFHWGEVADIWLYHFEVSGDSLFSVLEDSINTDTAGVTVSGKLNDGSYWWRVRSYDNINNWSDFSVPWKLTVQSAGIEGQPDAPGLPQTVRLSPVRPNPSRIKSEINYQLPKAGPVAIELYNITGARVATLVNGLKSAGYHTITWDLRDSQGCRVANGVYFLRLTSGALSTGTKITVIR